MVPSRRGLTQPTNMKDTQAKLNAAADKAVIRTEAAAQKMLEAAKTGNIRESTKTYAAWVREKAKETKALCEAALHDLPEIP